MSDFRCMYVIAFLFTAFCHQALGVTVMSLETSAVRPGEVETSILNISTGTDIIAGFNAHIVVPDSVSILDVRLGSLAASFVLACEPVSCSQSAGGDLYILGYSPTESFAGMGSILELDVAVPSTASTGRVELLFSGVNASAEINTRHAVSNIDGSESLPHTASSAASVIYNDTSDFDNDQLPDAWEVAFALDPLNPADASGDADGGGITNLAEFLAGTNPVDSSDDEVSTTECAVLEPPCVIELQVAGESLISPTGETLTVPGDVKAVSINVTAVNPGSGGFITVWPCGVTRPLSSNLNYLAGDIIPNGVVAPVGANGKVCLYSSSQTEMIVDIAGWFSGDGFVGATPKRLVDTRLGPQQTGPQQGKVQSDGVIIVPIGGIEAESVSGESTLVPVLTAAAINVTVVDPGGSGFVTIFPCDVERPKASNLNFVAGQTIANGVIAPASANGEVCIYTLQTTDIIVDLAGWFVGESFTGSTPKRLVDTRLSEGGNGPIGGEVLSRVNIIGETLSVGNSVQAVPTTVTASALNVTVVGPASAGFATVYPCTDQRPLASNLNFVSGDVVPNNVVAPVGATGEICVFTNVSADVIVDIAGWFEQVEGSGFTAATPKRLLDTRAESRVGPRPVR